MGKLFPPIKIATSEKIFGQYRRRKESVALLRDSKVELLYINDKALKNKVFIGIEMSEDEMSFDSLYGASFQSYEDFKKYFNKRCEELKAYSEDWTEEERSKILKQICGECLKLILNYFVAGLSSMADENEIEKCLNLFWNLDGKSTDGFYAICFLEGYARCVFPKKRRKK